MATAGKADEDTRPTVFEAWNEVMKGVQAISKDSRNEQQRFNFRGIDAVMNAVGPLLREHGVTVVPCVRTHEFERYPTKSGGQMVNRIVEVGFTVYGPRGDSFAGISYGEAADAGDKSIAKAQSVAFRTFLLQSLTIPTDDPDPDSEAHERAPQSAQSAPAQSRSRSAPAKRTQAAAKPQAKGNPESQQARDDLRAVAEEQGWDTGKVAAVFEQRSGGVVLKDATADEVTAFMNLLLEGAISLD